MRNRNSTPSLQQRIRTEIPPPKEKKKSSIRLYFYGLLVLVLVGVFLFYVRRNPINDISTSFSPLPIFVVGYEGRNISQLNSYSKDFNETQMRIYPDLTSLSKIQFPASHSELFNVAKKAASKISNWEITHTDEKEYIIQGIATTKYLRFKDDFIIQVRGNTIAMRSKSRVVSFYGDKKSEVSYTVIQ